jgi:hypothetical protein
MCDIEQKQNIDAAKIASDALSSPLKSVGNAGAEFPSPST